MKTDSCVFCGYTGELTNEDALPQWIAREFLTPDSQHVAQFYDGTGGTLELQDTWRSKLLGHPTECVCDKCNNRWMSAMENRIKPIIQPMFYGRRSHLNRDVQKQIARWATKTSYMLMYSQDPIHDVHKEYRELMYLEREIPKNALIYLATYIGTTMPVQYDLKGLSLTQSPIPYPRDASGELVTFSIGNLVFQVWISDDPGLQEIKYQLMPDHEPFVAQIWPVRQPTVEWPTAAFLNDDGFDRFVRNFG